ncbi:MAG: hypothetical protein Kow0027_22820 [Saprospiraceae bacterium]
MIERYFKVRLLSDVVLNASLATEGNMQTLDYIPGSNFLGIVAKHYGEFGDDAYDVFHSGKVSFGDAHIAMDGEMSYRMPLSLFNNKGGSIDEGLIFVHSEPLIRQMDKNKNERLADFKDLYPKQIRSGYFNVNGCYTTYPRQRFALKSAQDAQKRRSKDEAMFGIESIQRGQEFIFSVRFEDDKHVEKVTALLTGINHIGKSKSAQYGMVDIQPIGTPAIFQSTENNAEGRLILYAESNLCFLNEYGQPTFRPQLEDLGLKGGEINWSLSQIRTYSYSPWNGERNTTSTQRDVILKGSVIVVDDANYDQLPGQVGEYISEGLGRVVWNPEFLAYDEYGRWTMKLKSWEMPEPKFIASDTALVKQLKGIKGGQDRRKKMVATINAFINEEARKYARITSSQWGEVRKRAQQAESWESLMSSLFEGIDEREREERKGFLIKGVGAVKMWDAGKLNEKLKRHLEENQQFGKEYVVKLAAEMAKWKQRHDKGKI